MRQCSASVAMFVMVAGCGGDAGPDTADAGDDASADTTDVGDTTLEDEGPVTLPAFVPSFPQADATTYQRHATLELWLSRTRVLVLAAPDVARAAIEALAAANGAVIAGAKTASGIYLLELSDSGDHAAVDALVQALRIAPEVAAACHDSLLFSSLASTTWPGGAWGAAAPYQGIYDVEAGDFTVVHDANWGLELARVPALWNLRDFIRRRQASGAGGAAKVLVVDNFGPEDLTPGDIMLSTYGNIAAGGAGKEHHGIRVASVAGASWGNGGMDGVLPVGFTLVAAQVQVSTNWQTVFDLGDVDEAPYTFADTIDLIGEALGGIAPVDVVNLSQGFNWHKAEAGHVDPTRSAHVAEIRAETCAEGALFSAMIDGARAANPALLVTVSAGNEGSEVNGFVGGIDPALQSPWACAIIDGAVPNGLVIGSTRLGDDGLVDVAPHSNRPPTLFAPGQDVGMLRGPLNLDIAQGTSFASPFTGGVAALLHLLAPARRGSEIAAALRGNPTPLDTRLFGPQLMAYHQDDSPVIDAFAAAMALDDAMQLQIALADTDDGTRDGCRRLLLGDDGRVLAPAPEPEPMPATAAQGDGAVDMRDFRRWRDAYLLVFGNGKGLDGLMLGERLHRKMDLNGDGVLKPLPLDPKPPGNGGYIGENIWSRFDLNGDGVMDPALAALPFKGLPGRSDLAVMAEVWGQTLDGAPPLYRRPADVEGFGQREQPIAVELLRDLLDSTDIEVRVERMFKNPDADLKDVQEVEIHVWRAYDESQDEPPRGGEPPDAGRPDLRSQGSRRVHRDPAQWVWQSASDPGEPPHRLTFTVPLGPDDKKIFVKAYYVTQEADPTKWPAAEVSLLPTGAGAELYGPDVVGFAGALAGEDRAVAFGPQVTEPTERYVYMTARDDAAKTPEIWVVTPGAPPEDLVKTMLSGLELQYPQRWPSGGLGCSADGKHVSFRVGQDVYVYRNDGSKDTYSLGMLDIPTGGVVVSDALDRLAFLGVDISGGGFGQALVVKALKGGQDKTVALDVEGFGPVGGLATVSPHLSFAPDGGSLLLNLAGLNMDPRHVELDRAGDAIDLYTRPWQLHVAIEPGRVTAFYDKVVTATDPDDGEGYEGRVQTAAASFAPGGTNAVFFSNEALLYDAKAGIETDAPKDPLVGAELYQAAPGEADARPLTSRSGDVGGKWRLVPAMSPTATQVLYWTHEDGPIRDTLRLLDLVGGNVAVVHEISKDDGYVVGLQDTAIVCWLAD